MQTAIHKQTSESGEEPQFHRSLRLIDGILLVVGSMIGSGIFIVSTDITAQLGSGRWLILIWALSAVMTIVAAVSYGELSGMFPKAGGQYVYLQEAYGDRLAFLYGWSFFGVIETGTIAAVAVAFAKYTGYLIPSLGENHVLFQVGSLFSVSAAQILAIFSIIFLTYMNSRGIRSGKWIQFVFTFIKVAALLGLIFLGFWVARNWDLFAQNWASGWQAKKIITGADGSFSYQNLTTIGVFGAVAVAMVGALFSSDAWNSVTFIAGEIKNPKRNIVLSLFLGTLISTVVFLICNFMYISVLTTDQIASAPNQRTAVAAAQAILGVNGAIIITIMIMISTFGCNNGLILSGARVYYQMAKDGLFFSSVGKLNRNGVPGRGLWIQALWASVLCLSGHYSDILNFIIFTVLLFYILTILGIYILRRRRPNAERPYKAVGYPLIPAIYMILAGTICVFLLIEQPLYSGMGLLIVLIGLPVYVLFKKYGKKLK